MFMVVKKTMELSISNNYLLDDESSKKVMDIVNKKRQFGRIECGMSLSGLSNNYKNINQLDLNLISDSDENLEKLENDFNNDLKNLDIKYITTLKSI